ncbi:MAG TPA: MSMEG_6728 family protein [Acidimicrobiales bacterium]|nr:MSMEG_6728 family protein [Acidimicrobiales bacterium]
MQTFLPYADFARCAAVLDTRRLGKQRVEVLQILRAIIVPGYGWRHHPAAKMWKGYEEALGAYGIAICREWCRRGHTDTCDGKIRAELAGHGITSVRAQAELAEAGTLPAWLGDEDFHRAHRSSLLNKDPEWYGGVFTDVPPDLPYVWPGQPPPAESRE